MSNSDTESIHFNINSDLKKQVEEIAEREHRSNTDIYRDAIVTYVNGRETKRDVHMLAPRDGVVHENDIVYDLDFPEMWIEGKDKIVSDADLGDIVRGLSITATNFHLYKFVKSKEKGDIVYICKGHFSMPLKLFDTISDKIDDMRVS